MRKPISLAEFSQKKTDVTDIRLLCAFFSSPHDTDAANTRVNNALYQIKQKEAIALLKELAKRDDSKAKAFLKSLPTQEKGRFPLFPMEDVYNTHKEYVESLSDADLKKLIGTMNGIFEDTSAVPAEKTASDSARTTSDSMASALRTVSTELTVGVSRDSLARETENTPPTASF